MKLSGLKDKLKWLDPFTYVDLYVMPRVNPHKSEPLSTIVYIVFAFIFAFVLYTVLGFVLGTSAPLVIVLSGSMEPVMYRGDIILMTGAKISEFSLPEVALNDSLLSEKPFYEYVVPICTRQDSGEKKQCMQMIAVNPRVYNTTELSFSNGQTTTVTTDGPVVVYTSSISSEPVIHRSVAKINANDGSYLLTKGDSELNPLIDQQAGITFGPVKQEQIIGKAFFRIPLLGYLKLLIFDDIPVLLFGCNKPFGCPLP